MNDTDDYTEKISEILTALPSLVKKISLQEFNKYLVYNFDQEAKIKNWQPTHFQNVLENIWDSNIKSCVLAPRSHLKTSTVLSYLIKKVYTRKYPLEISYYHLTGNVAEEKFGKLLHTIESNPLLAAAFRPDKAKQWTRNAIELEDGTIIKPLSFQQGVRGKHPHIIVLDDVIDASVVYSEVKNKKAIEKFYTDIYPMITKSDESKKIIVIGTAQRKDDLYHMLPNDFTFQSFQAVLSDEKKEILSPELFTYEELMKLKADISFRFGERFWLKEYMNMPFEAMGLIVKPEWIKEYYQVPTNLSIFQGWDLAVGKDLEKGDWTVCVTIGVEYGERIKIYVLDIFRERINFGARLNAIQNLYNKWKPNIIGVEEVAFQYDTIQTLQQGTMLPIQGVKPIMNKVQSFQAELAPYFENGQIHIKPEMSDFRTELLSLPIGQYDDQADALKIAIKAALLQPATTMVIAGGMIAGGILNKKF
ncbi:MAG TPA: hypothetical protein VMR59_04185 [Patescibacteria group bacterium]|nr:hypothetical protein [Patescibacteria group bacterium]